MKKTTKLGLKKVTLRDLDDSSLQNMAGGTASMYQSGCGDYCPTAGPQSCGTVCDTCAGQQTCGRSCGANSCDCSTAFFNPCC
jgi:hypothetical protein